MKTIYVVAIGSWTVSAALAVQLWRRNDPIVLKIGLSLVLLIPILGPLLYIWIQAFPPTMPPALQDHGPNSTDVLDRWRAHLEQRNVLKPLQRMGRKK